MRINHFKCGMERLLDVFKFFIEGIEWRYFFTGTFFLFTAYLFISIAILSPMVLYPYIEKNGIEATGIVYKQTRRGVRHHYILSRYYFRTENKELHFKTERINEGCRVVSIYYLPNHPRIHFISKEE